MSKRIALPIWKEVPFLRIILLLIISIIVQESCCLSVTTCFSLFCISVSVIVLLSVLPISRRFRLRNLKGYWLFISLFCAGLLITSLHQPPLQTDWIGHYATKSNLIVAEVIAAPVEKEKSFKISGTAKKMLLDSVEIELNDPIIIYVEKDSACSSISIGDQICFAKPLQEIKGAGNPGSFDYKRYCELQQLYYQVYLPCNSFGIIHSNKSSWRQYLQSSRNWLVAIIKKYIPSRKEAGLAEALLIAYKDDLDKTLVQSYANTGVVHIIAISGLHLGLVYWLLATLLQPVTTFTRIKWLKPAGVIAGLWLFSLLAGASPSVLRSAVMFSFLATGELLGKKTHAINNLAASAFLLLCYNPFWLWDAGFQLSYAAVLSLLLFMKPVYALFTIKNKWLDLLLKMNAVTISAQILTVPICIYYFHQFPNAFLITNLIAVPLSSGILFLELALCALAGWATVASYIGQLLQWLLFTMNSFIEFMSRLPFAVWEHLYLSLSQTLLFYTIIACFSVWLLQKSRAALLTGLIFILLFLSERTFHSVSSRSQKKLIVYNIPKKQAVDIIMGNNHYFIGDSSVNNTANNSLSPLYINRLQCNALHTTGLFDASGKFYSINGVSILFYSPEIQLLTGEVRLNVDFLLISNNPKGLPEEFLSQINCRQIVLDASNNYKTVARWQKAAAIMGIACHSVVDNGAFVINLP